MAWKERRMCSPLGQRSAELPPWLQGVSLETVLENKIRSCGIASTIPPVLDHTWCRRVLTRRKHPFGSGWDLCRFAQIKSDIYARGGLRANDAGEKNGLWSLSLSRRVHQTANGRYLQVHQQPEALLPRQEEGMQNKVVGCEARLPEDFQTASSVMQTCCSSVLLPGRSNINLPALQGPERPHWEAVGDTERRAWSLAS